MAKIGFIGLGVMGSQMVDRLLSGAVVVNDFEDNGLLGERTGRVKPSGYTVIVTWIKCFKSVSRRGSGGRRGGCLHPLRFTHRAVEMRRVSPPR